MEQTVTAQSCVFQNSVSNETTIKGEKDEAQAGHSFVKIKAEIDSEETVEESLETVEDPLATAQSCVFQNSVSNETTINGEKDEAQAGHPFVRIKAEIDSEETVEESLETIEDPLVTAQSCAFQNSVSNETTIKGEKDEALAGFHFVRITDEMDSEETVEESLETIEDPLATAQSCAFQNSVSNETTIKGEKDEAQAGLPFVRVKDEIDSEETVEESLEIVEDPLNSVSNETTIKGEKDEAQAGLPFVRIKTEIDSEETVEESMETIEDPLDMIQDEYGEEQSNFLEALMAPMMCVTEEPDIEMHFKEENILRSPFTPEYSQIMDQGPTECSEASFSRFQTTASFTQPIFPEAEGMKSQNHSSESSCSLEHGTVNLQSLQSQKPFPVASCSTASNTLSGEEAAHTHMTKNHGEQLKGITDNNKKGNPGLASFECPTCKKKFEKKPYLRQHQLVHSDRRPFPCTFCEKSFKFKAARSEHTRKHTGEKPFKCRQCPKSYKSRTGLHQHTLSHTGQRPYTCSVCPKTFITNYQLTVHSRNHTGERPFICCQCGKGFKTNQCLNRHILIHNK